MIVVQLRNATEGRAYYDTRKAGGMPSMMAMRCLKRRLSNVVFARMLTDQNLGDVALVIWTASRWMTHPWASAILRMYALCV